MPRTSLEQYHEWPVLKDRIRALGMTVADVAHLVRIKPPTLGCKLNGTAPMRPVERHMVETVLDHEERRRGGRNG